MSVLKLFDNDAIAEFIAAEYKDAKKIVEVMVGYHPWVAQAVKKRMPNTEVFVVDRYQDKVYYVRQRPELKGIEDDILNPNLEIYRGARLIYAIRPPEETLPYVYDIAAKVGADVLIRPLTDVDGIFYYPAKDGWHQMSYKRSSFWLLKRTT